MKIAIEGMDGAGKTTVAMEISKLRNIKYIDKPLHLIFDKANISEYETLNLVSNEIYKLNDPLIKAWFFGMGNLFSFRNFKNEDLIIDRHFASNYFWNGTLESNIVFKTMKEVIGVPDLTILLYATLETRIARLYTRNPIDKDIFDEEKNVDGYDKMIKFLNDFEIPYCIVDTENKTINMVIDEVNNIIDIKQRNLMKKARQVR